MSNPFKALVVEETDNGNFERSVRQRSTADLPDYEVLIEVHYSALNYKDALSATGNKGVTQEFPHTPGVDAAGVVAESDDERFSRGDEVIVTSFDLGQNTDGGFGHYIRVPGDWIVPLPDGLTLRKSMMWGTAGFTAAYGVHHLMENGCEPETGPVLVTGATGGVGSLAVALLAHNNFEVTAATGKMDQQEYLESLGAKEIINRNTLTDDSGRPLLGSKWAGALDTVGGDMLDVVLRQTQHNGTVACCGNILGGQLHTSIYPFILRGIGLIGIDSGMCKMPMRKTIWNQLATDWKISTLDAICRECTLSNLNEEIDTILAGKQVGKVLVKVETD